MKAVKTILFVENDPVSLTMYQNRLQREGFYIETAQDGLAALRILSQSTPDLVVLDLMLPRFNGGEVFKIMRTDRRLANVPVVIFSNAAVTEWPQDITAGTTKCLPKSESTFPMLLQTIQDLLLSAPPNHGGPMTPLIPTEPVAEKAVQPIVPLSVPAKPETNGPAGARVAGKAPSAANQPVPKGRADFLANALAEIPKLREICLAYIKAPAAEASQQYLSTLHQRMHFLSTTAIQNGCARIFLLTNAFSALISEIIAKPSWATTSALQTMAQAVDCLRLLLNSNDANSGHSTTKAKVLAVDDDAVCNHVIMTTLRRANFDPTTVESPVAALELLQANQYDLVLLDVNMPDMTGFQVCEKLRRIPHCKSVPVVFVTAYNNFDNRKQSVLSGGNDFITKPISPLELALKVTIHMLKAQAQRANLPQLESESTEDDTDFLPRPQPPGTSRPAAASTAPALPTTAPPAASLALGSILTSTPAPPAEPARIPDAPLQPVSSVPRVPTPAAEPSPTETGTSDIPSGDIFRVAPREPAPEEALQPAASTPAPEQWDEPDGLLMLASQQQHAAVDKAVQQCLADEAADSEPAIAAVDVGEPVSAEVPQGTLEPVALVQTGEPERDAERDDVQTEEPASLFTPASLVTPVTESGTSGTQSTDSLNTPPTFEPAEVEPTETAFPPSQSAESAEPEAVETQSPVAYSESTPVAEPPGDEADVPDRSKALQLLEEEFAHVFVKKTSPPAVPAEPAPTASTQPPPANEFPPVSETVSETPVSETPVAETPVAEESKAESAAERLSMAAAPESDVFAKDSFASSAPVESVQPETETAQSQSAEESVPTNTFLTVIEPAATEVQNEELATSLTPSEPEPADVFLSSTTPVDTEPNATAAQSSATGNEPAPAGESTVSKEPTVASESSQASELAPVNEPTPIDETAPVNEPESVSEPAQASEPIVSTSASESGSSDLTTTAPSSENSPASEPAPIVAWESPPKPAMVSTESNELDVDDDWTPAPFSVSSTTSSAASETPAADSVAAEKAATPEKEEEAKPVYAASSDTPKAESTAPVQSTAPAEAAAPVQAAAPVAHPQTSTATETPAVTTAPPVAPAPVEVESKTSSSASGQDQTSQNPAFDRIAVEVARILFGEKEVSPLKVRLVRIALERHTVQEILSGKGPF